MTRPGPQRHQSHSKTYPFFKRQRWLVELWESAGPLARLFLLLNAVMALCVLAYLAATGLAGAGRSLVSKAVHLQLRSLLPTTLEFKPTVTLTVNTTLFSHGDYVLVSWTGVKRATERDAIALYSPAAASPEDLDPLKYKWAVTSPTHLTSGEGNVTFKLLNQRHDVAAMFFYNVTSARRFGNLTLAGRSEAMQLAQPNEPLQGHLALTGNPSEMLVQWTSRDPGSPTVKWGTEPGKYEHSAAGRHLTYTAGDLCGAPANATGFVDPGAFNHAVMTDLRPSTWYYYIYGDQDLDLFSTEASFLTGPPINAESDGAISFIATADFGHVEADGSQEYDYEDSGDALNYAAAGSLEQVQGSLINVLQNTHAQQGASAATARAILADVAASQNKTLMFINGDISYARGQLAQWDVFHDNIAPLLRRIPLMVVDGNHERDFPRSQDRYDTNIGSGGECGIPAHRRFRMPITTHKRPKVDTPTTTEDSRPSWYSFNHGPVHFLQYSTEVEFTSGSPQHKFIVKDLSTVDRSVTPWVIVGGHRPLYSTSINGGGKSSVLEVAHDLQGNLENVFYTHHVDVTLHGHDHVYERTCPVFRRKCLGFDPGRNDTANATVHVVIGNAGYGLGWFVNPAIPPYWDSVVLEHGYLRCDVTRTVLHCQELSSLTGRLLDEFTLTKPPGWKPDQVLRRAERKAFVGDYQPVSDLEDKGLGTEASAESLGPVLAVLKQALGDDPGLIKRLRDADISTHHLANAAGGGAETVVDLWAALEPIRAVMAQVARGGNITELGASTLRDTWIPILRKVEAAAQRYAQDGGALKSPWLEALRATPEAATAQPAPVEPSGGSADVSATVQTQTTALLAGEAEENPAATAGAETATAEDAAEAKPRALGVDSAQQGATVQEALKRAIQERAAADAAAVPEVPASQATPTPSAMTDPVAADKPAAVTHDAARDAGPDPALDPVDPASAQRPAATVLPEVAVQASMDAIPTAQERPSIDALPDLDGVPGSNASPAPVEGGDQGSSQAGQQVQTEWPAVDAQAAASEQPASAVGAQPEVLDYY